MKTPITVRIEADLLEAVRHSARQENRTLTNFIETVLRRQVGTTLSRPLSTLKVGPGRASSDAH